MAEQCQECGKTDDDDDGVVVGFAGEYGPVCHECWALFLRQETVLSKREAEVAALKNLNGSHRHIAEVLGIEKSTVDTYAVRIIAKIDRAARTVDELGHMSPEGH